ncbi:MAG: MBG domain-containing protein, partial [Candidatus Borkfalkiaceae bacterium]|nr:MBG domain-containing protein [Christensenellaceae bacterium]
MKQSNKKTIVCVLLCVLFSVISAFALVGCKKTEVPKKTKLDSPVIASKTYTGSNQKATVAENEAYEVTVNAGGTNVGEYDVVLTLTDKKKYEWTTPDADDKTKVTLKFAITKAANEITSLTLADWTYDEQANEPTATAKFGTAAFTYSATQDGEYTATVPSGVGKYWVKATVEGTSNYDGAIKTAQFEIKKAAATVTTAPAAKTELVYNRNAQELVTAGVTSDGTLNYKLGENGTWSET